MTAKRHPTAQVRSDYAAANIAPGAALAVAVHLEFCPVCAIGTEAMSASGETFVTDSAGDPIAYRRRGGASPEPAIGEQRLPRALQAVRVGAWRWLRPRVKAAALEAVAGLGEAVYLLKAAPGARLPLRRRAAVQQLVVIEGAFRDGAEAYLAGDYVDGADALFQDPRADRLAGCVCLIVTDASWPSFALDRLLHAFRGG